MSLALAFLLSAAFNKAGEAEQGSFGVVVSKLCRGALNALHSRRLWLIAEALESSLVLARSPVEVGARIDPESWLSRLWSM